MFKDVYKLPQTKIWDSSNYALPINNKVIIVAIALLNKLNNISPGEVVPLYSFPNRERNTLRFTVKAI